MKMTATVLLCSVLLLIMAVLRASCDPASWEIVGQFPQPTTGDQGPGLVLSREPPTAPPAALMHEDYRFRPRFGGRYCHCLGLHECPAAVAIFRARQDDDVLSKRSCGFDGPYPYVCCNLIVADVMMKRRRVKQKRDYHNYHHRNNNNNNNWRHPNVDSNYPTFDIDERTEDHHFFWDSKSFPHWSHAPTETRPQRPHHRRPPHDECEDDEPYWHKHHHKTTTTTWKPPKRWWGHENPPEGTKTTSPVPLATYPTTPDPSVDPTTPATPATSDFPITTSDPLPSSPATLSDTLDGARTRDEKRNILGQQVCGTTLQSRIVGGETAELGDYPWMARLGYTRNGGDKTLFRCGGTLISDRYILTAAHCVTNLPDALMFNVVRLGELDERTDVDCDETECGDPPQDYAPESIVVHPNYNNPRLSNDIALIRLNASVNFTEFISPLCLPFDETQEKVSNFTGMRAIVAGWGSTNTGITSGSPTLQWVRLTVIPTEECMQTYRTRYSITISASQLCTAGIENMDACEGDSGGPLFVEGDGVRRATLIGIVSFGPRRCGTNLLPGVYTNVYSYLDWILDSMGRPPATKT